MFLSKLSLNAFQLKVLAIVSMTIAHVDLFFDIRSIPLYLFGRLAFPIFAFLIANGAYHTKSLKRYALRLFAFAVASQVPYVLINRSKDPDFWELNILFTLFFGLLSIIFFKKIKHVFARWFLIIAALLLGDILLVDYGFIGILSILLFYIFLKKRILLVASQVVIFTIGEVISLPPLPVFSLLDTYQILHFIPFSLLALIPILTYNNKQGSKTKYLFYLYYPLHFIGIMLLMRIFGKL